MFPCEGGMHLLMAGFSSIVYLRGKVGLRELSFESDASAVGCVNLKLSGKECDKALLCHVALLSFYACFSSCCGLVCSVSLWHSSSFSLTF